MEITLNDGTRVSLREIWHCCDGARDCGSKIVVTDMDADKVIAAIPGILPDEDDEDFDLEEYTDEISRLVDEYAE